MKYYAARLLMFEEHHITNCVSYADAQKAICDLYYLYYVSSIKASNQTSYEFLIYNKHIIDLINAKNYLEASELILDNKFDDRFHIYEEYLKLENDIKIPIIDDKIITDELKKRIFK